MFTRAKIFDGDATTSGGLVKARPQSSPVTYDGINAAYEGDPVWCPVCQTDGASKCVQPRLPDIAPDGRQALLDGDLCLCRCTTPPRLLSSRPYVVQFFEEEVIRQGLGAAAGWLEYAGLASRFSPQEYPIMFEKHFRFVDSESGVPLANRRVLVRSAGSATVVQTDSQGLVVVKAASGQELAVHLVFSASTGEMTYSE